MARADERSLTTLQENAERNREELRDTVSQLRSSVSTTVNDVRHRVSPESVKAEVGDYFRTRADALLDKARENPLQTAAIGLGVAYPVMGILRAIPAPVMMIGAGLFLMGSSSGRSITSEASRKLGEAAGGLSDRLGEGANAASETLHTVQDRATAGLSSARDRISSGLANAGVQASVAGATVRDGASNFANSASERMTTLKDQAVGAAGIAADTVRGSASRTGSMMQDTANTAANFASDTAFKVRDRALAASHKASSTVGETIQQYPLFVGGVGLALGMLLASALPRSDLETTVMGNASAGAKKRAGELASQGFDAAKSVASSTISNVVDHAGQEGLNTADLNEATEDFGRRVRKVVDSAADAALGAPSEKTTDAA